MTEFKETLISLLDRAKIAHQEYMAAYDEWMTLVKQPQVLISTLHTAEHKMNEKQRMWRELLNQVITILEDIEIAFDA